MKKVKTITLLIDQHDYPTDKFQEKVQDFLDTTDTAHIVNMSSTITDKRYYFFCVYDE